jgi:hypothetical protein
VPHIRKTVENGDKGEAKESKPRRTVQGQ